MAHAQSQSIQPQWKYYAGGRISNIAISSDGKYIAAVGIDNNVYLLDANGNKLWQSQSGDSVYHVTISDDGQFIAAFGKDNLYLFDHDGNKKWQNATGNIFQIAMSGDGRYMVAISNLGPQGTVYLFDREGNLKWQYDFNKGLQTVEISDDGKYIAASSDGNDIYLFDNNGTKIWQNQAGSFVLTTGTIYCISMSGDGQYIAAQSLDHNVYLFNRNGSKMWQYQAKDSLNGIAISSDDQYIVASDTDNNIYFIGLNGTQIWQYQVGGPIFSIAISGDGRYVVAGSTDKNVYLFDRMGTKMWQYQAEDSINGVGISRDGQRVVASSYDNNIYMFQSQVSGINPTDITSTNDSLQLLSPPNKTQYLSTQTQWKYDAGRWVSFLAMSSDCKYIVAGGDYNNNFYLFDQDGNKIWQRQPGDYIMGIDISGDGQSIIVLDKNYLNLYDRNGDRLWQYFSIKTASLSGDGQYIAASNGNLLLLFNRNGSIKWQYTPDSAIESVAISSDGRYVVAECYDRTVLLFDYNGSVLWHSKMGSNINTVTISDDGQYFAVIGDDNTTYMFDRDGNKIWQYQAGDGINCIAISSDDQYVAIGSKDNNVYFFNRNGTKLWQYDTGRTVPGIALSSDSQYIAVASGSSTWKSAAGCLYLFDRNGTKLWQYDAGGYIHGITISNDGQYMAALNEIVNYIDEYTNPYQSGSVYLFKNNISKESFTGNQFSNQTQQSTQSPQPSNNPTITPVASPINVSGATGLGNYYLIFILIAIIAVLAGGGFVIMKSRGRAKVSASLEVADVAEGDEARAIVKVSADEFIGLLQGVVKLSGKDMGSLKGPGIHEISFGKLGPGVYSLSVNIKGKDMANKDINKNLEHKFTVKPVIPKVKLEPVPMACAEGAPAHAVVRVTNVSDYAAFFDGFSLDKGASGDISFDVDTAVVGEHTKDLTIKYRNSAGREFSSEAIIKYKVKPAEPDIEVNAEPAALYEGEKGIIKITLTNTSEYPAIFDDYTLNKGESKTVEWPINGDTPGDKESPFAINYKNPAGRSFEKIMRVSYKVLPAEPVVDAHVDSIDIAGKTGVATVAIINHSKCKAVIDGLALGKGDSHKLKYDLDVSIPGSHEKIVTLQFTNQAGRPFEKEVTIAYKVHPAEPEAGPPAAAPASAPMPDGSGIEDKLVFISYAMEDKNIADAVCHSMEEQKIRCWIAPRDVLPGIAFEKAIIKGINDSNIFIIVYSSYSNDSPHVENEVREAWRKGIPIIPFRVQDVPMSDVLRYYISSKHWLDAMTPPLQKHIDVLIKTVRVLLVDIK